MKRIAPALGLFFLAPFIGEFLLGNVAIDAIFALPILAPLYGGGALLIREIARRTGRGWPAIVLLGCAYAVFEESIVTQLIFNPDYPGVDMAGPTWIPALGINASVVLAILSLHAGWSICVSIALMEALVPDRRTQPWLSSRGLWITAAIFLAGSGFITWSEIIERRFIASSAQLGVSLAVIAALIALGLRGLLPDRRAETGGVPPPWAIVLLVLLLTMLGLVVLDTGTWWGVGAWGLIVALLLGSLAYATTRKVWSPRHAVGAICGAILTYAWIGFPQVPTIGTPGSVDTFGNTVFTVVAFGLVALAWKRTGPRISSLERP